MQQYDMTVDIKCLPAFGTSEVGKADLLFRRRRNASGVVVGSRIDATEVLGLHGGLRGQNM